MTRIEISISDQCLDVYKGDIRSKRYPVSTSKYGSGCQCGSYRTPLGRHCISEKIGTGAPHNEVFIGRIAQGVLDDLRSSATPLPDDLITSRILWLSGLEPGINQGGEVDTHDRYIYIHGTPEEDLIGQPVSHGCIRMRNADVIELFDQVETGCPVLIKE